jgi:hypothetical protein
VSRTRPQQQQHLDAHQQLLRRALATVHDALHEAASAPGWRSLLAPALSFLAAAASAVTGADARELQQTAAAAACAALASATVSPWLTAAPNAATGLAEVLNGCKGLLIACRVRAL